MRVVRCTLAYCQLVSLGAALLLAACSDGRSDRDASMGQSADAQEGGGAMSGMEGMPGMQGTDGRTMNEQMQAHLRMMDGADADSLHAMLPTHRQLVTHMIAQFNMDMRGMGMSDNAAWDATVDSLQQDLTRMSEMSASALQQWMPAHGARVRRLMESHGTMIGDMKR